MFFCQQCGNETPKWQGRCPACGAWNSVVEAPASPKRKGASRAPGAGSSDPVELAGVVSSDSPRLSSSLRELDRVLGGGIVPGSLVLLGGDPGIGKSTLLLEVSGAVKPEGKSVLYISGEESLHQIRMRADRLGIRGDGLFLLSETNLDSVLSSLDRLSPGLVIIDSIQTLYTEDLNGGAGSVGQVRECTLRLMQWAKEKNTPVFIAGHVTKEGDIAGPRVLEHMVDVVLYLEGEPFGPYRILRSVKNRFGSTNEVGVFQMEEQGLREVDNPSKAFLAERDADATGSAVVPTVEGTRTLMVEIQALTNPTPYPNPRRIANGVDFNRMLMITAVLSRRAGLSLANQDIIVNVVGGLRVEEPAADLGIALAIASSYHDAPVKEGTVILGEVGLNGELRSVSYGEKRLSEAASLGFADCLCPSRMRMSEDRHPAMGLNTVDNLRAAIRAGLVKKARDD